ncbi:MAG: hypothetical protein ABIS39_06740 [Sphingomicrobium sp.]
MTARFAFSFLLAALAAGCSSTSGDIPSLQPRAAERIDPRLPVGQPVNDRPTDPALAARLDALVSQARSNEAGFETAIAAARRAAVGAGAAQSESWIVAQEALSGAVKAREAAATAMGAIDAIGADLLIAQGGLAPADLAAIQNAAEIVAAIDRRQAEAVAALHAHLGG